MIRVSADGAPLEATASVGVDASVTDSEQSGDLLLPETADNHGFRRGAEA